MRSITCKAGWVAVLIVLAQGNAAWAGRAWNPAMGVSSTSVSSSDPVVAVDGHGNAVAAWLQTAGATYTVEAADHPAGGNWSVPVALSSPGPNVGRPVLALDANGDAFAAWARGPDGYHIQIDASYRPAGGSWQATPDVFGDPGVVSADTTLAVNARGDEVLAWRSSDSTLSSWTPWATYRPTGGSWLTATRLSGSASQPLAAYPATAIDPQGGATVVWEFRDAAMSGSHLVIQASRHVPGGSFSWSLLPATLSNSAHDAYTPAVAADANGNVTAIWGDSDGANPPTEQLLGSDFSATAGTWSAHTVEVATGTAVGSPTLAFDGGGDAIAAWTFGSPAGEWIQSSTRPAGGSWPQNGTNVSNNVNAALSAGLSVAPDGTAVLGWKQQDAQSGPYMPTAAIRAGATGAWSAPHTASSGSASTGGDTAVAIDARGNAVMLWDESGASNRIVRGATYSAPTINSVSIPSIGVAGTPVNLSISPFDVWSPLTTTWTFGDGTQATGTSVNHTYGAPGHYPVSVSTANLGLATATSSATITISATPVGTAGAAPVLSSVSQSHTAWARASKVASISANRRSPVGTTFSLTLNQPATLRLAFSRITPGRKVGRRCMPATRANRKHSACQLGRAAGTLTLPGHIGVNKVAFFGQISRTQRLAKGAFTVSISATSAGKTSSPAKLRFSIVK